LFEIEKMLHDVTPEERYEGRLKHSRPVLDKFKEWLKYWSPRVTPKSSLGKAIQYCRNQWDKLEAFMLDGRLEIDNNRSERSIKPFESGGRIGCLATRLKEPMPAQQFTVLWRRQKRMG